MTGDTHIADQITALLPRLHRYGRAVTGNTSDADDLVQATCEKALRSGGPGQVGVRTDLWLFRIMRNHWLDHVRSAAVRRRAPEDALEERGDGGLAARQAEDRLMLERVRGAMRTLKTEHREVLALVVLEGMSYCDAADTLQVPQGTVMSRLARARTALASALNGKDVQR